MIKLAPSLNRTQILDRGWTKSMIVHLLGQPDKVRQYSVGRRRVIEHLFALPRIKQQERTNKFKALKARADSRREKLKERRAEAAAKWEAERPAREARYAAEQAERDAKRRADLVARLPQFDESTLQAAADANYAAFSTSNPSALNRAKMDWDRYRRIAGLPELVEPTTAEEIAERKCERDRRVAVNYIRHHHTSYEVDLRNMHPSRLADRAAYYALVFEVIAQMYPWLAQECERQRAYRVLRDQWKHEEYQTPRPATYGDDDFLY